MNFKNYAAARKALEDRCKKANLELVESEGFEEDEICLDLALPAGRDKRWIYLWNLNDINNILKIPFEKYRFLNGYKAICSYEAGEVEAVIEPLARLSPKFIYRKLFPTLAENDDLEGDPEISIDLPNGSDGINISIGPSSNFLKTLVGGPQRYSLSLKLNNVGTTQHDQVVAIIEKLANALFFQIDMLFDIPLGLQRERKRLIRPKSARKQKNIVEDLNYPENEYDEAPISLYWYGKSAVGMPLLQFLAYYQVIEFYFPIYYQAEVRRKISLILKDPTFRNDRDADLAKIIGTIQQNRSGGLGDERSQLRATLNECIDAELLREFLTSDEELKNFLSSKAKGLTDHKLPIANVSLDLRNDVADRMYDIRCKIVHTKSTAEDGNFELLLPFSKEAEQLKYDIDLIHYLAQRVLISGSSPLQLTDNKPN